MLFVQKMPKHVKAKKKHVSIVTSMKSHEKRCHNMPDIT